MNRAELPALRASELAARLEIQPELQLSPLRSITQNGCRIPSDLDHFTRLDCRFVKQGLNKRHVNGAFVSTAMAGIRRTHVLGRLSQASTCKTGRISEKLRRMIDDIPNAMRSSVPRPYDGTDCGFSTRINGTSLIRTIKDTAFFYVRFMWSRVNDLLLNIDTSDESHHHLL